MQNILKEGMDARHHKLLTPEKHLGIPVLYCGSQKPWVPAEEEENGARMRH